VMKTPFRGTHGHIALRCNNLERALSFLGKFGYAPVMDTAKSEKNRLKFVYLDKEIGGFAVHLIRD
jgi:2-dehydro-3-deoxyphosphogluconate aldolase/(4S)-4-hydroxy-2-oxoglutarate aldolase